MLVRDSVSLITGKKVDDGRVLNFVNEWVGNEVFISSLSVSVEEALSDWVVTETVGSVESLTIDDG